MSLLPLRTQINAQTPLYAPASGGGGGGGGGGPNPAVSTLSFPVGNLVTNTATPQSQAIINFSTTLTFSSDDTQTNVSVIAPGGGGLAAQSGFIIDSIDNGTNLYLLTNPDTSEIFTSYSKPLNIGCFNGGNPVNISSLNVSSINGAAPGGGGSVPANLACSTLIVNDDTVTNGAVMRMRGADPNLYDISVLDNTTNVVAGYSLGTIGGRNQFYTARGEMDDCMVSSIQSVAGAPISILDDINMDPSKQFNGGGSNAATGVSFQGIQNMTLGGLEVTDINPSYSAPAINVGAPLALGSNGISASTMTVSSINGGPPAPKNVIIPFITGSGDGSLWTANVPENTGGSPVQLTSTLVTNPANTYLVSYSLVNGLNNDVTSVTRVKLYTAAADVQMRAYQGDAADFVSGSSASAVSMLVSGASALRLEAGNTSATTSTIFYFDQPNSVRITDLGSG